jgi:hypothetical protein
MILVVFSICSSEAMGQERGSNYKFQIVSSAENTWGYDIMMDGKLFIHQPFAPGIRLH